MSVRALVAAALLAALGAPAPARAMGAPEAPRQTVDTAWPAAGRTVAVAAGGSLQAALDAARPGDVLALAPGATFTGPFTLPKKAGDGWIVIRPHLPDSELPPPGTRMTPAAAARLPKLVAAQGPVVRTAPGAHHYRLVGLQIHPAAGAQIVNVVELGGDGQTAATVPHHLVIDRCYLRGDPAKGARRGVALNSAFTAIVDSHLADFKAVGTDSQAVAGWAGPGPFRLVNNHLEAAGENVMFGGADPGIADLVPSDIEVRGNLLTKPLAWKRGHPDYQGTAWAVKNLFELKNARRVVIDGNVFARSWAHGQEGFAILFTVRSEDGAAPWAVVEDVAFTNNVVREAASGVNLLGRDRGQTEARTRRVLIRNNLFVVGGPGAGSESRLFQLLEGTADVVIDHNTAVNTGSIVVADGAVHTGFVYTNNIAAHNEYGIVGSGTGPGAATLGRYFPRAVVRGNVLVGAGGGYPRENFFPGSLDAVGFADAARGDYRLAGASRFRGAAGGRDPGADLDALAAAGGGERRARPARRRGRP